jgi:hypothetical protein
MIPSLLLPGADHDTSNRAPHKNRLTRRTFLRNAALLTAATAIGTRATSAATEPFIQTVSRSGPGVETRLHPGA